MEFSYVSRYVAHHPWREQPNRNASFVDEIPVNCPPMERYSSSSLSGESISDEELELPSTPSMPALEQNGHADDPSAEDLHIFPAELGVGTEFSISTSDDALLESSLTDSPTISHSLFSFTESVSFPSNTYLFHLKVGSAPFNRLKIVRFL